MLYALMPRVFHSRKIIFILPQRPRLSWATCWLMHISPILLHHKFFLLILDFKQLGIHPLLSFQVLQLVCPLMSFLVSWPSACFVYIICSQQLRGKLWLAYNRSDVVLITIYHFSKLWSLLCLYHYGTYSQKKYHYCTKYVEFWVFWALFGYNGPKYVAFILVWWALAQKQSDWWALVFTSERSEIFPAFFGLYKHTR